MADKRAPDRWGVSGVCQVSGVVGGAAGANPYAAGGAHAHMKESQPPRT